MTESGGDKVAIYKVGSTSPLETINGNGFPYQVSVENLGKPKGTAVYTDEGDDAA